MRSRLIARYGEGPAVLQFAWDAVPVEARHWKPSEEDWSAHDIIVHCADSETFAATRIRLLVAETHPMIVGYDQDQWVRTFRYEHVPAELVLTAVAAVRALTSHLITHCDDLDWRSEGTHSESGPYSAEEWLQTYAEHLHDHADQIRANVDSWRAGL